MILRKGIIFRRKFMIIMFYRLLLVLSVCLTLVYVMTWHKHFDVHVSLIFVLVPISVLGNLIVAESRSYWEALAEIML